MKKVCLLVFAATCAACGTSPHGVGGSHATENLERRVYEALEGLESFGFTVDTTTRAHQRIERDGVTVLESDVDEALHDGGLRVLVAGKPNVAMRRWTEYPRDERMPIRSDLRLVDGTVYANVAYLKPREDLPVLPEKWFVVREGTSVCWWPALQLNAMDELVAGMRGEAISLFTGQSMAAFRADIHRALAAASVEHAMWKGHPAELITLTVGPAAYRHTVRAVDMTNPANAALFGSLPGTPMTHTFVFDESGRLAAWERRTTIDVQGLDVGGARGMAGGTRLYLKGSQTVAATINPRADATGPAARVPTAREMAAFPHMTGGPDGPFGTLDELDRRLSEAVRGGNVESMWAELAALGRMPLVYGPYVVFLYRSPGAGVSWIGDWSRSVPGSRARLGATDVWVHTVQLPADARFEYQIQVDDGEPVTDPLNPETEVGGLGSKSVLAMPRYRAPEVARAKDGIARGGLTEDQTIRSVRLGYDIRYRVYTPPGYDGTTRLPVLYVTDGQDFLAFGRITTILDNLIADGRMRPVLAALIDPRDIATGRNLREEQLLNNPAYAEFVSDELASVVEATYGADPSPEARALLGASYGGYFAAAFALRHADRFHLVGMLSPSFWYDETILDAFRAEERLPVRIFLSVGRFNDDTLHARLARDILTQKGYELTYVETNEGHSYGNWRGRLEALLTSFFPAVP